MTDDRDPLLQSLFADAQDDLDGEVFTAQVMAQTRFLGYRQVAAWLCAGFGLAAAAWFFAIPFAVAQLVAQVLTTALVDLGDSWLAWAFSPINNVASVLILGAKGLRAMRKKIVGSFYAY